MGEAFISAKCERFNHQTDAAVEKELKSPDVLTRLPTITMVIYRCIRTANVVIAKGERLLIAEMQKAHLSVLRNNEEIGYVENADSQTLRKLFSETPHKMVVATVEDPPQVSSLFTVTVTLD
jgi:hypothetical protein